MTIEEKNELIKEMLGFITMKCNVINDGNYEILASMIKDDVDRIISILHQHTVSGSLQPLTVNRVSEMMQQLSKETWIAVQGDEHGWKEWYAERCKLNLNSNDR